MSVSSDGDSSWMQLDAVLDNCEDFLIHRLDEAATHFDYCQTRDIITDYLVEVRSLMSRTVTSERNLVQRVFGGDCARIVRLRVFLGAMKQMEKRNQVVSSCLAACHVVGSPFVSV